MTLNNRKRINTADALKLVSSCYQQKVFQMQKEIEGLKDDKQILLQITSQKMLIPAMQIEEDSWIIVTEAADIASVKPGTISHWVEDGKVKSNGKKGVERRILKSSLLLHMEKRKDTERQKGYREYRQTLDDIPEEH